MTTSVCFVAPNAYPMAAATGCHVAGGAEAQTVEIARALAARGCRVSVVVGDFGQAAAAEHDGVRFVRCRFEYLGGNKLRFVPQALELTARLAAERPDVCLTKGPPVLLPAIGLAARVVGFKLVKLVQSEWDCEKQPVNPGGLLYALGTRLVDRTVFQTVEQMEAGQRNLGLSGVVIPNFAAVSDRKRPAVAEDVDVLWIGACDRNKNPEAFLELAERIPERAFAMIMTPRDDAVLLDAVERRAATLPNLRYLGFLPKDEIPNWCDRSRLVAGTSGREGFPNVYLEAWLAGKPVVSLFVDPDHVITRRGLGRVSGSMPGMARDIRILLADRTVRQRMGRAGRDYVRGIHSPDRVTDLYLELFKELTADLRGTRRGTRCAA